MGVLLRKCLSKFIAANQIANVACNRVARRRGIHSRCIVAEASAATRFSTLCVYNLILIGQANTFSQRHFNRIFIRNQHVVTNFFSNIFVS